MNDVFAGVFAISTCVMMVLPFVLAVQMPSREFPNPHWGLVKGVALFCSIFYLVVLGIVIFYASNFK